MEFAFLHSETLESGPREIEKYQKNSAEMNDSEGDLFPVKIL